MLIEDCKNVMNQMKAIYQKADKGNFMRMVVVSETVMEEMQEVVKAKKVVLYYISAYSNMANYY